MTVVGCACGRGKSRCGDDYAQSSASPHLRTGSARPSPVNTLGMTIHSSRDWFVEGVPGAWLVALEKIQKVLTECQGWLLMHIITRAQQRVIACPFSLSSLIRRKLTNDLCRKFLA